MLKEQYADIYYKSWGTIEKVLKRQFRRKFPHQHVLADYTHTLDDILPGWRLKGPIVISGPTNMGKTGWAAAHTDNPMVVKNIEDLKMYDPYWHDMILFDDCCFNSRTAEWALAILDFSIDRTVDARYAPVQILAMTPMIFTTNIVIDDSNIYSTIFPLGRVHEQNLAIRRRYTTLHITSDLRKPTATQNAL